MQVQQAKDVDAVVVFNVHRSEKVNGFHVAHEEVKEQNSSPITVTISELINAQGWGTHVDFQIQAIMLLFLMLARLILLKRTRVNPIQMSMFQRL